MPASNIMEIDCLDSQRNTETCVHYRNLIKLLNYVHKILIT